MKRTIALLFSLLLVFAVSAKDADKGLPTYEIAGAGVGNQGTYLVKVTVVSKSNKADDSVIRRCAVHGVLFKGFANEGSHQSTRPLAGSGLNESQHADFYKDFFAPGGASENYVSEVKNSRSVVKSGKEYKISTIVTVLKEQLMKDLQQEGIIKGLNSIF
jgi:hypothetical protein